MTLRHYRMVLFYNLTACAYSPKRGEMSKTTGETRVILGEGDSKLKNNPYGLLAINYGFATEVTLSYLKKHPFSASVIGIITDAQLYLPIGKLYCFRSYILLRKVIFTHRVSCGKYNITLTASQNITFRISLKI